MQPSAKCVDVAFEIAWSALGLWGNIAPDDAGSVRAQKGITSLDVDAIVEVFSRRVFLTRFF